MIALLSMASAVSAVSAHEIESLSVKELSLTVDKDKEARLRMIVNPSKLASLRKARCVSLPC